MFGKQLIRWEHETPSAPEFFVMFNRTPARLHFTEANFSKAHRTPEHMPTVWLIDTRDGLCQRNWHSVARDFAQETPPERYVQRTIGPEVREETHRGLGAVQSQSVEPRAAKYPTESSLDAWPPLSQGLGSRSSTVAIESMIHQLLAKEHVLAARKLIEAVSSEDTGQGSVRRLRTILAKPIVRRRLPPQVDSSGDIDWLRKHPKSYSGKWVALAEGRLVAADESLAALRHHLKKLRLQTKPLLHRL